VRRREKHSITPRLVFPVLLVHIYTETSTPRPSTDSRSHFPLYHPLSKQTGKTLQGYTKKDTTISNYLCSSRKSHLLNKALCAG